METAIPRKQQNRLGAIERDTTPKNLHPFLPCEGTCGSAHADIATPHSFDCRRATDVQYAIDPNTGQQTRRAAALPFHELVFQCDICGSRRRYGVE